MLCPLQNSFTLSDSMLNTLTKAMSNTLTKALSNSLIDAMSNSISRQPILCPTQVQDFVTGYWFIFVCWSEMCRTGESMLLIQSKIAVSEYPSIRNSLCAHNDEIICIRVLMLPGQIHKSVPDIPYIPPKFSHSSPERKHRFPSLYAPLLYHTLFCFLFIYSNIEKHGTFRTFPQYSTFS